MIMAFLDLEESLANRGRRRSAASLRVVIGLAALLPVLAALLEVGLGLARLGRLRMRVGCRQRMVPDRFNHLPDLTRRMDLAHLRLRLPAARVDDRSRCTRLIG